MSDDQKGISGWLIRNFGPIVEKAVQKGVENVGNSLKADFEAKLDAEFAPLEQSLQRIETFFPDIEQRIEDGEKNVLASFGGVSGPLVDLVAKFNAFLQNMPHIPGLFMEYKQPESTENDKP